MDFNILFDDLTKKYKTAPVKLFPDRNVVLSYADISRNSRHLAYHLQQAGIKKGDVVSAWMGNTPEFVSIFAAVLRLGAIFVPIGATELAEAVQHICEESACSFLFADSGNPYVHRQIHMHPDVFEHTAYGFYDVSAADSRFPFYPKPVDTYPEHRCPLSFDEDVLILYTSGTIGQKKGIRKNLRSYVGSEAFLKHYTRALSVIRHIYPLIMLNLCPWHHSMGMHALLIALCGGYYQEITLEAYNPKLAFDCLKTHSPNIWLGTTSMLYRCCMSSDDRDIEIPAFILSGGEALSRHVIEKLESYPKGGLLLGSYGSTEAGLIATIWYCFHHLSFGMRILAVLLKISGLVGTLYKIDDFLEGEQMSMLGEITPNTEVLIFDNEQQASVPDGSIGEICARTTSAMTGYLDEANGSIYLHYDGSVYVRTGDLGWKKDQNLYLSGRIKNMIIRSGENILPANIERAVHGFPGANAAVACGVPSVDYGEEVCLCLEAEESVFDLKGLQQRLKSSIPKYMYPKYILFFDSFPSTPSGKIDIATIKKDACNRLML